MCKAIEKEIQNQSSIMSSISNLPIAFLMLMAAAMAQSQGFSMSMIPIVSPRLPFFPRNLTLVEIHQNLVKLSKAHALRFMTVSPNTKPSSTIRSPVKRAFSGYLYVEIYIGSPPVKTNLALDTGSDIPWVQCSECTKCFPVSLPNFNRRRSTTYQPMSYDHPLCSGTSLPLDHRVGNESCSYLAEYLDNQSSEGDVGFDTFTFLSKNGQPQPIPHVAFGCGLINNIDAGPEGPDGNPIGGILGLQKGRPSSILQQLRSITLQRFSYCLPLDLELGDQTLLHFGNDAQISGPSVQTTPFLDDFYMLKLNGISLNSGLLQIDPMLFSDGFFIDSGTVHSMLVRKVYDILQQAMIDYFQDNYGWLPLNESARLGDYELCYELHREGGGRYVLPTMTLHFEGTANLELNNIFRDFDQANQFCMTLLRLGYESGPNILGALQQANYRFLFDAAASKLSFAEDMC